MKLMTLFRRPIRARRPKEPAVISGGLEVTRDQVTPDSDVHTLMFDRLVSVTPLSLDLTSRVDLKDFRQFLES